MRPDLDLEKPGTAGYTRLLFACSAHFDPEGHKVDAIKWLVYRGANARSRCEPFSNSTLHLVLLSARRELIVVETWKGDSKQLRAILAILIRAGADIHAPNLVGLTPSDIAKGLKCTESWNDALRDCGLNSDIIEGFQDTNIFDGDLEKQFIFERWSDDYEHFTSWECWPDSCSGTCPWWTEHQPWCRLDLQWENL